MSDLAIGLDLGGTQIKAAVVSDTGEIIRRESRPTGGETAPGQPWAHTMRALAEELGPSLPVGISAPGLAARDARSIAFLPNRLPGLENLDWTTWLRRERAVPVANDAHSSLLGEAWIGAARGMRNVILLTLGTGVGGAAMCDGRLLRGHVGRAGHLGHICLDLHGPASITGTPGALECFIGNYNIRERTAGRFDTTHALVAAFRAGDADAREAWMKSIRALAGAIASFINILDPEAVVIGGGVALAGDALFSPLATELDAIEWRPGGQAAKILPAALGEWAGAIGAAREAFLKCGADDSSARPVQQNA
jgi:glucokinase